MLHGHKLSWIGLVLLLCSAAVGVASPLLANAAQESGDGTSVNTLADINNRYYAGIFMRDCLVQMGDEKKVINVTGDESVDIGILFGYNRKVTGAGAQTVTYSYGAVDVGRYFSSTTGNSSCGDTAAVKKALIYLGLTSTSAYLKKIGYTYNESCTTGPAASCTKSYTSPAGGDTANSLIPSQIAAAKYYAYQNILNSYCENTVSTTSGSGTKYNVIVASGDGFKVQEGSITLTDPNLSITKADYNGQNWTCKELAGKLSNLAKDTSSWNNDHKADAITTGSSKIDGLGESDLTCKTGQTWDSESGSCQGNTESASSCTAGALGWIMCPLVGAFQALLGWLGPAIDNTMAIQPLLNTDSGTSIQNVWKIFVGFANLVLVIAFLIVIFSQATSVGLSAYGIKKMLPRIIAAAILINLSFFICAIAVDVTNILAGSVQSIVQSIASQVPSDSISKDKWDVGQAIGANIALLAGAVTGVTLLAMGYISFIIPALIAAGMALITIFFGIAIRQVLVYVLIFIAPLAFAAMILPNTEQLFTKWRKLFVNMLLLYPVIMFMLYGSGLVASLILAGKAGTENTMIDIMAFLVATIAPFAGIYMYIKNSNKLMSMAGTGVNKLFGGMQNMSNDWAKRKKDNNRFQQKRQLGISAQNTARNQRNLTRMSQDGSAVPRYLRGNAEATRLYQQHISEQAEKIHESAVKYAGQTVRKEFNASDARQRVVMADRARAAAMSGDQVQLDAIMSHAAAAGADEYTDVYDRLQAHLRTAGGAGALATGGQYHDVLSHSNSYVYATAGAELGSKNRGLASMLQTANPDLSVKQQMREDFGIQTYYTKMSAEKISGFSSDTAKASAQFLDDDTLNKLVNDPNVSKNVGTSARAAFEAEIAARAAGAAQSAPRDPVAVAAGRPSGSGWQPRAYAP